MTQTLQEMLKIGYGVLFDQIHSIGSFEVTLMFNTLSDQSAPQSRLALRLAWESF